MGYGEFGGGGSVKWELDVDDTAGGAGKKRVNASGRDDQSPATFTVTIEYNDQVKANQAWAVMRSVVPPATNTNTRRIDFTIPFDDHGNHRVKVNWP